MKFLGRILIALAAMALLGIASIAVLGPHAEIAQAFERYRSALEAGDAALVTKLTAPAEIEFAEAQRKAALSASRSDVERLGFRERAGVLGLRKKVLDGKLPLQILQDKASADFFAAALPVEDMAKALKPMAILFALPTGSSSARGYIGFTQGGAPGWEHFVLALASGAHYRFARSSDGTWLVDPTPVYEFAAGENEGFATRVEPTGNLYITQSLLQEADKARADRLWEPLVTQ
jgi:hypothetical protein